jgi:hypothetical protein
MGPAWFGIHARYTIGGSKAPIPLLSHFTALLWSAMVRRKVFSVLKETNP